MSTMVYPIRLAQSGDDDFILGLAFRFAAFPLPPWRVRRECVEGARTALRHCLETPPANCFLFVAENPEGAPVGFIHLQKTEDFFTRRRNGHIADLAVAPAWEGRGVGRALLAHAHTWAREHRCELLTLAVFPGNERARAVYARAGFGVDLLRLAKPIG